MSISMDHFASFEVLSTSRISDGSSSMDNPYQMQCRTCGFEHLDAIVSPERCPKCAGDSWERFALPGHLVSNGPGRVRKRNICMRRASLKHSSET
jgi:hypothetical protein